MNKCDNLSRLTALGQLSAALHNHIQNAISEKTKPRMGVG